MGQISLGFCQAVIDPIVILQQVVKKAYNIPRRDLEKANDTEHRHQLWEAMRHNGVDPGLIKACSHGFMHNPGQWFLYGDGEA